MEFPSSHGNQIFFLHVLRALLLSKLSLPLVRTIRELPLNRIKAFRLTSPLLVSLLRIPSDVLTMLVFMARPVGSLSLIILLG